MDTMSQTAAESAAGPRRVLAAAPDLGAYEGAGFPWYGLDEGWSGSRWAADVCTGPAGVEHGTLGHGDPPGRRPGDNPRRFVAVVTVPLRPKRPTGDGTGLLEATSCSSAASLAATGLLKESSPWRLDRALREDWLTQQTYLAWDLADQLDSEDWTGLALPVDGVPSRFRYRETDDGWILAGEAPGVYIGAYGRGASAYGLGLSAVSDLSIYAQ
jgi:hypothetical protein